MTDRDPAVAETLERTRPRPAEAADWDDVVRRTAGSTRPAPRRPLVRALRWAPGLAGGVAIAAVLGVMVVRSGDAPPSAAPKGVTGVEALVHVTSTREGQTDEQAAERMETMLIERARIQGITGFRTERSGTALSVFVPRTQNPKWVRGWLPLVTDFEIYDLTRSMIARGTNPIAVAQAASDQAADQRKVHYLVIQRSSASGGGFVGPFATRAEAAGLLRENTRGARSARVFAVPATTRLLAASRVQGDPKSGVVFVALRDPLLGADGIRAIAQAGNRLDVGVIPQETDRLTAALSAGSRPVIVVNGGGILEMRFVRFAPGDGTLQFRSRSSASVREAVFAAAGGQVDALTDVEAARRVGPVPPSKGTPVTRPGRGREAPTPREWRVLEGTVRRVVTLRGSAGSVWWVWAARTNGGNEVVGTVGRGRESIGGGSCEVDPRRHVLSLCMAGSTQGSLVTVGRASDAVRTVTIVTEEGVRVDGAAANGFFLAAVPVRAGRARVLIARDRQGGELGRLTSDDPLYGGFFR